MLANKTSFFQIENPFNQRHILSIFIENEEYSRLINYNKIENIHKFAGSLSLSLTRIKAAWKHYEQKKQWEMNESQPNNEHWSN